MNALQEFLLNQDLTNLTKEIDIGGRLKGHPLKVRAIDGQQYTSFQQMCIKNPNSPKKRSFDTKKFNELIAVNGLVDPNLKDAEMIQAKGVSLPAELLYKVFLAGEINTIAQAVLELSGFETEIEEIEEEVKNS